MNAAGEILKLRVTLVGCKPAIWRDVEVPSAMTLAGLHDVLQVLMGWEDCHLWCFELDDRRFELPDPDGMSFGGKPPEDPRRVRVGGLLTKTNQVLDYYYDFGDSWCLDVSVVAGGEAEPRIHYPRCVAGQRAGPPEDCGGIGGLAHLLKAHKNPKNEDDRELLEWVGEDWDPGAFDLAAVNEELATLRAPRSRR